MTEVVVSTECPTCGAPLEFPEGTNAVRCGHCASNLLVTGRKHALSYWVPPNIDRARALADVKAAGPGRLGRAQLYFIPYYRLTGHEFRWERPPATHDPGPPPRPRLGPGLFDGPVPWEREDSDSSRSDALDSESSLSDALGWTARNLGRLLGRALPSGIVADITADESEPPPPSPAAAVPRPAKPASRLGLGEIPVFRDRYLDRSFLATELPELGVESLGVRPSVVRLSLYRREAMEKLGRIVGVEHPVDEAIAIGMRTPDASTIVSRTIIARVLSIIYFPFWIVGIDGPSGSRLAVVDAIGDTVVRLDAPPSLTTRLDRTAEGESEIVGFRPLACPNCGADLPVAADDVIFYCASCERAWHLHGVDFDPVPIEVADVKPAGKATDVRYLPCWVLTTEAAGTPTRLFAPAFRFQRLRGLSELARRLTRSQPSWGPLVGSKPPLRGCYYDVEDAWLLARFTEAGLRVTVRDPAAPDDTSVAVTRATLTWLPFTVELRELIDPFTNMALPEAGLR